MKNIIAKNEISPILKLDSDGKQVELKFVAGEIKSVDDKIANELVNATLGICAGNFSYTEEEAKEPKAPIEPVAPIIPIEPVAPIIPTEPVAPVVPIEPSKEIEEAPLKIDEQPVLVPVAEEVPAEAKGIDDLFKGASIADKKKK